MSRGSEAQVFTAEVQGKLFISETEGVKLPPALFRWLRVALVFLFPDTLDTVNAGSLSYGKGDGGESRAFPSQVVGFQPSLVLTIYFMLRKLLRIQ